MKIETNKTSYIFDVDGTLTEPRKMMTPAMAREFKEWASGKELFIATGSDYAKTKQQVPESVLNCFKLIFCCMGNEIRDNSGYVIEKSNFQISEDLDNDLMKILKESKYHTKTGNHIEFRTGMVNFSIVGRSANFVQRSEYNSWDAINSERQKIVDFINKKYPTLDATIGGSISIDINEEGKDKGQIINYLENKEVQKIVFVGDKCYPGGNDYGIIRELKKSNIAFEWYQVENTLDTLALLRTNKVFDGGK